MLTLKKIWVWIKKHWYVPVLFVLALVGAIVGLMGFSHNKNLIKMLEINKKSYEDQIRTLNENHEAEIKKRDELYETYVETMKKLTQEHKVDLENMEREKKDKLDNMVKKYKGSPEELAKELSEMFGVEYDG